jgi:hypothetical protein
LLRQALEYGKSQVERNWGYLLAKSSQESIALSGDEFRALTISVKRYSRWVLPPKKVSCETPVMVGTLHGRELAAKSQLNFAYLFCFFFFFFFFGMAFAL